MQRWPYVFAAAVLLWRLAWARPRRRHRWLHAAVGLSALGLLARAPPYSCEDMALDCSRLLDSLGVKRAHLVGFSMGGMIAQTFALEHPKRCLSLVLVATCHQGSNMATANLPFMAMHALTTGDAWNPRAGAARRQTAIERFWKNLSAQESRHDSGRVEGQRQLAAEELKRGSMDLDAYLRQVMAVLRFTDGAPKRPEELPPTLVIHGAEDPLIPVCHGLELAKLMRCQRCVVLPGLGHDVLTAAEDEIFAAVAAHLDEAAAALPGRDPPGRGAIESKWEAIRKSPSVTVLAMEERPEPHAGPLVRARE